MTPLRGCANANVPQSRLRTSSVHGTGGGSGPARGSAVWQFFSTSPADVSVAACNLCEQRLSRGRPGTHLGTSALIQHMRRHHAAVWEMCSGQQHRAMAPRHHFQTHRGSTSLAATAVTCSVQPQSGQEASVVCCSDEEGESAMTKVKVDQHGSSATDCQPQSHQQQEPIPPYNHQMPLPEQKHAANHPLVRQLNAHLTTLLVTQSLPHQLVDSSAFHKLMVCAQPQWRIPSSHYFFNKAIPALYAHVSKNIAHSLDFSLCSSVHTTAETWHSGHNQEHYLTFTAHWVNLVSGGENGSEVELVTPPRMARSGSDTRRSSLTSISLSHDQSQSITAQQPTNPCPPCYNTCKVKRCHAILHHMSLGDRSHTATELQACMSQQIARWFAPRLLHVANVVCDNSKSIVTALHLGKLKHAPSFTHILNSAVHSFLTNYPGVEKVVAVARKVCSHFSRSYAAKNILVDLQRQNGLPVHKLTCDVATQWNSTLQMLERLYEQRKAIDDYMICHGTNVGNLGALEASQWQLIRGVCHLLKPFEEATRFVSRENCGMNDVIPLIFILEKALTLMQRGEEDVVHTPAGSHNSGGETREGDRMDEDGHPSARSLQIGDEADHLSSTCATGDHDDNHKRFQWPVENEASSQTLAGMASYMLTCLQSDPHISEIKQRDDYWVATLLDPRYKSKMGKFFEASEREAKLRHYQATLCGQLTATFTDQTSLNSAGPEAGLPHQSPPHQHPNTINKISSATSGHYSLFDMMENFFQPPPHEEPSHRKYQQHFEKMVASYLDCSLLPDNLSYDPMSYWVSKLDQWPELAQLAIERLTCPPSSVLSDKIFREPGVVTHPKTTKLSPARAERSTFIKINEHWIRGNFLPPLPDNNE